MQNITIFAIMANSDSIEGRGHTFFTGIGFKDAASALAFTKSRTYADRWGIMGNPGGVWDVREMNLQVYDSFEECAENISSKFREDLRISALAKLTPKEREALGF